MPDTVRKLSVVLTSSIAGLKKGFRQAEGLVGRLRQRFSRLDKIIKTIGKGIGVAFAGVSAVIAGVSTAIVKLGQRGAAVGDVAAHFEALSRSVGETAEVMLGALRRGTENTLKDFELMRLANKALGAGLVGTADDFEVLAAGARLLAKRTGGETAQAFDTLTTAMASGRTAQLKQLGLFVDNKQAVENYAAATHRTVGELNDADRAMALQIETLRVLRGELKNNAPAAADFGEKIEQLRVRFENLYDQLALAISESPVLLAALDSISRTMEEAFGADQAKNIKALIDVIEGLVKGLVSVGRAGIAVGRFLTNAWHLVEIGFRGLMLVFAKGLKEVNGLIADGLELATKVPKVGGAFEGIARAARQQADMAAGATESLKKDFDDAIASAGKTNAAWDAGADVLARLQVAMDTAGESGKNLAEEVKDAAEQEKDFGEKARDAAAGVAELGQQTKGTREEAEKLAKVLKDEGATSLQLMVEEAKALDQANVDQAIDEAATSLEGMVEEAKALREAELAQLTEEQAESLRRMKDELKELNEEAEDRRLEQLFTGLALIAGTVNDDLEATVGIIENVGKAFREAKTPTEKYAAILAGIGQIGGQIGGVLGSAIQGAAGGALTGLQFGPIGAAIGGGLGLVSGLITGGAFRKEEQDVNDLRDAFFEAQGGFEAFSAKMAEVSDEDWAKKIFDAKTVEEFNALVNEAKGLLDTQTQAQQALQEAIDRYGFTIEELGPTMQRQKLDEQAAQLLQDFRLLTASGIDVNTVIERMGPNLLDFVKTSIAAGQAIPEAMRPMVEQLIASGQLLDENGNAFQSAEEAGITFAETLTEGLSRAVDAIERLVAALTGVPPVNIPVNVSYREHGRPEGIPLPGIPDFQTGGIGEFGSGTLAMLHGLEAVVPLDRGGSGPFSDPALLDEIRQLRTEQPRAIARAVREAMAFSRA